MFKIHGKKIWVAGHNGMVGKAVVRQLEKKNCEILTVDRQSLDLTIQQDVNNWLAHNKPDAVILCAAKVGGILANDRYPAEFIYQNLMIEANIINAAHTNEISKLLFLGSSCIYPKHAPQPMKESALLTGPLENTNEWYALAKIAGIKLCQAYRKQYGSNFISAMPTNLYGPYDNFDLETSHVIPALIRKTHEAKLNDQNEIIVWGTGKPLREFMHVDDCADGIIFLLENYSGMEHVNLGTGQELSIGDLVEMIKSAIGFKGTIQFDNSKPDGTPRKLLNSEKIEVLGWSPNISLQKGLKATYQWYLGMN
ncbi:MAG: GDP-L-fucose synthase [Candidatus Micropelagos thuwalensis]